MARPSTPANLDNLRILPLAYALPSPLLCPFRRRSHRSSDRGQIVVRASSSPNSLEPSAAITGRESRPGLRS